MISEEQTTVTLFARRLARNGNNWINPSHVLVRAELKRRSLSRAFRVKWTWAKSYRSFCDEHPGPMLLCAVGKRSRERAELNWTEPAGWYDGHDMKSRRRNPSLIFSSPDGSLIERIPFLRWEKDERVMCVCVCVSVWMFSLCWALQYIAIYSACIFPYLYEVGVLNTHEKGMEVCGIQPMWEWAKAHAYDDWQ
jgi:hypothetical protein